MIYIPKESVWELANSRSSATVGITILLPPKRVLPLPPSEYRAAMTANHLRR